MGKGSFGYEGDPMRLLFSKSASPHHGFAAYYSFIGKNFKADVVLHFGTHGSLEFMPGKQVGMSDVCYPDSLIGNIPNIYYYAANNPSEATIANRRSYANTISYLTPPAENAGLYKGLKQLSELIASYQSLKDTGRGQQIVSSIISTAKQCSVGPVIIVGTVTGLLQQSGPGVGCKTTHQELHDCLDLLLLGCFHGMHWTRFCIRSEASWFGFDVFDAEFAAATVVSLYLGGLSSDKSSFIGPYSFEDDLQPVEKNMQ
ncbi:hypothetical protein KIW84_041047 [Lathyrus oleraceus]|uniref:CobN/magnesium chelatase domain-containing protein n=1 Tax=Pisum sativum TaxID=3888 RepID=A0A9D4XAH9_PEA|nr:hypothetical protein KIW84_041047 [Pisum sativum]